LKTGHIVSGAILVIIATVLASYAAWLWVTEGSIGTHFLSFWEATITMVVSSIIMYIVGAILLWKGRNDWLT